MGYRFRTESAEALYDYVIDAYTDSVGDDLYDVMPTLESKAIVVDEALADATEFADRVRDAVEAGEAVTLFGVDYVPASWAKDLIAGTEWCAGEGNDGRDCPLYDKDAESRCRKDKLKRMIGVEDAE